MPLPESTRSEVVRYALADLPGDLDWHVSYFDFIGDSDLRYRLGQEFYAARCLYKLWEGLRIDEPWARQAQVQLQVQQYASIYEASIHHLLFVEASDEPIVQRLHEYEALVERPLPDHIMKRIRTLGSGDAKDVVGAVLARRRTQESKIRFDSKVAAAVKLGILEEVLGREIAGFYTARNYIHIHAELRQTDVDWQVSFARDAYRRMEPFKAQVSSWLAKLP
ncbi:hypothetical protein [Mycobacteroides abscessus]|uniref:hypothetical protein n=1 Tax=Mycobacteroides abscessus TaxID=36809 RepID=UPI00051591F7|nr:hypothetical protein [Mycobacteroides abscessus]ORA29673.1 hypothetical protein BST18_07560 [Mycobacteroides abscessus subsp. bolletii]TPF67186.1 hypothetical protein XW60_16070 [Mycobacteroides abscessus subsp. bolletii]BBB40728.1 hypothetical protein MASB_12940 [Mycobacteroides abscessus subsp. bolletii BD]